MGGIAGARPGRTLSLVRAASNVAIFQINFLRSFMYMNPARSVLYYAIFGKRLIAK